MNEHRGHTATNSIFLMVPCIRWSTIIRKQTRTVKNDRSITAISADRWSERSENVLACWIIINALHLKSWVIKGAGESGPDAMLDKMLPWMVPSVQWAKLNDRTCAIGRIYISVPTLKVAWVSFERKWFIGRCSWRKHYLKDCVEDDHSYGGYMTQCLFISCAFIWLILSCMVFAVAKTWCNTRIYSDWWLHPLFIGNQLPLDYRQLKIETWESPIDNPE